MSVVTKAQLLKHAQEYGPTEVLETACELLSPVEVCELARELVELEAVAAKKARRDEWYPNSSYHPTAHRALRNRMRRPPDAIIDQAILDLKARGLSQRDIARIVGVRVERVTSVSRTEGVTNDPRMPNGDTNCPQSSRMDTEIAGSDRELPHRCLECSKELPLIGKKVYCSDACRKAASRGGRRRTRA
jgi:hypothetical protein